MKRAMWVALWLGLAGCSRTPVARQHVNNGNSTSIAFDFSSEAAKGCPDEASQAVLDKLYPVLDNGYLDSEFRIARQQEKIRCIREWSRSIKDPCVREGYDHWLDHYSEDVQRHLDELATKKANGGKDPEQEEYDRKRREEEARVRAYMKTHEVPAPESCDLATIKKLEKGVSQ